MVGEVALDPVLFLAAKVRIGEDDSDAILLLPADVGAGKCVVVPHEAGIFDAVQQHVGDAEHMRQRLFFYGAEGLLHQLFILGPLHVTITHVTHGAGEETAGATRRVEDDISGLRSEERRTGKECVSPFSSRWSRY